MIPRNVWLNESTWLKTPIPKEVSDYLEGDSFLGARLETADAWRELLAASGLRDLVISVHALTAGGDFRDRLKWFGVGGAVGNLYRLILLSLTSPAARRGIKRLMDASRRNPEGFYQY